MGLIIGTSVMLILGYESAISLLAGLVLGCLIGYIAYEPIEFWLALKREWARTQFPKLHTIALLILLCKGLRAFAKGFAYLLLDLGELTLMVITGVCRSGRMIAMASIAIAMLVGYSTQSIGISLVALVSSLALQWAIHGLVLKQDLKRKNSEWSLC